MPTAPKSTNDMWRSRTCECAFRRTLRDGVVIDRADMYNPVVCQRHAAVRARERYDVVERENALADEEGVRASIDAALALRFHPGLTVRQLAREYALLKAIPGHSDLPNLIQQDPIFAEAWVLAQGMAEAAHLGPRLESWV